MMSIETIIALLAALGIGGILGAILNRHYEQQKQINNHDVKIFEQSNKILTEQKLVYIANFHLLSDHSIKNGDFSLLTEWCMFFRETGNQYLDRKIAKENQRLVNDLDQLTDFIATNFFTIRGQNPNNENQYLKPDWNLDRGDPTPEQIVKYNEYAKELKNLINKAITQYSDYRLVVKRILKI